MFKVHEDDIGLHVEREVDGLPSGLRFADELDARELLEHEPQTTAERGMVVGHHDSDRAVVGHCTVSGEGTCTGSAAVTTVPPPGSGSHGEGSTELCGTFADRRQADPGRTVRRNALTIVSTSMISASEPRSTRTPARAACAWRATFVSASLTMR